MTRWNLSALDRTVATWLIVGICAAVSVLFWFGYRATREWRRSVEILEQRRAEQAADVFVRALARDMRGAEAAVLRNLHWQQITLDRPYDVSDMVAAAFARYPYPEAFFGWSSPVRAAQAVFFTRADRRPEWLPAEDPQARRFPVTVVHDEVAVGRLSALVAEAATHGRRYAVFEIALGGKPYQVVARLLYRTSRRAELMRVFGFVVNLNWVRRAYFGELAEVVSRIAAADSNLTVSILDDRGELVTGTPGTPPGGRIATRRIPAVFFDPALVALDSGNDLAAPQWTIRVSTAPQAPPALALGGADRMITITTLATVALGFGLLLTGRALGASADLAKLRCDFVSSVTHELKTPLSTIRGIGETLSRGRIETGPEVREYAQLLDQEAKRLARLVDNLLAYSRVTDVSDVYSFEPLAAADLLDDVLRGFQPQIAHQQFDVTLDVPADLPDVRGDRTALGLVFDNVVDNAIRYSGASRWLSITARQNDSHVDISIRDRGVGIPQEELSTVVQRFFRGRHADVGGSGLGLAIANRVVRDHGGMIQIDSQVGIGTTVQVSLPVMEGTT